MESVNLPMRFILLLLIIIRTAAQSKSNKIPRIKDQKIKFISLGQGRIQKIKIILIVMSTSKDKYNNQSPTKILNRAEQYSKTIDNHLDLPKQASKSFVVKSKAQKQTENIDFAIRMAEYQKQLFRHKQSSDIEARKGLRNRLQLSHRKINSNLEELSKKRAKKGEEYEKHVKEVFQKYTEEERQKRLREKEQSFKLRQQLQEFYEKEKQRKSHNDKSQVQVGTCYQSAVDRLNYLHRQNQIYAQQAELSLQKNMSRNSRLQQRIRRKRRLVSECNRRKPSVYSQSLIIERSKKRRYIQTCAKNQQYSREAWQKIGKSITDWRKKREESNKRDLERWRENKHRVEESKASVPDKCLTILDKTSRATFRRTASTFRHSANKFEDIVQQNKKEIQAEDEFKKDEIMDLHLDLTLKNCSSARVSQKMHSMRQHARKLAYDFL